MAAINREERKMKNPVNTSVHLDITEVPSSGTSDPTLNNLEILRADMENNDTCDAIVLNTAKAPQYEDVNQMYLDSQ